jgi:hypothetical protein
MQTALASSNAHASWEHAMPAVIRMIDGRQQTRSHQPATEIKTACPMSAWTFIPRET